MDRLNAPSLETEKQEFERGFRAGYLHGVMKMQTLNYNNSIEALNACDGFFEKKIKKEIGVHRSNNYY